MISDTSLGRKSIFWVGMETGGSIAITLGAMLLLARMIGPVEFGTAALVIGSVAFLNLFVEYLFHDALIQNPSANDDVFEAAFSLVILIAAIIVLVGFGTAIIIRNTQWSGIAWLFVGASLSLPFSGALGIGNARMRRDQIFRDVARAALMARLVGSMIGLCLAFAGCGAWSLVSSTDSIVAIQVMVLFGQSGWRPRLHKSFTVLWPMCRFALPYAIGNSLSTLRVQGFSMMIAGFVDLTAAGYVNVAFRMTTTPQFVLNGALTNLGLPLLSKQQHSPSNLTRSFLALSRVALPVTIPTFVGLALSAKELVPIILGPDWITVIPLVRVLALGVAISFLRFPMSSVIRALGHARYSFASSLFQLMFTFLGMLILRPHDMRTAICLWVLPTIVQLPLAFVVVCRISMIGWRVVVGSLMPVIAATGLMSGIMSAVVPALQTGDLLSRLVWEICSGAATVILALLLLDGHFRAIIGVCGSRLKQLRGQP